MPKNYDSWLAIEKVIAIIIMQAYFFDPPCVSSMLVSYCRRRLCDCKTKTIIIFFYYFFETDSVAHIYGFLEPFSHAHACLCCAHVTCDAYAMEVLCSQLQLYSLQYYRLNL